MEYKIEKLRQYVNEISRYIYRVKKPIKNLKINDNFLDDPFKKNNAYIKWDNISVGEFWGGRDITAWFRATIKIEDNFRKGKAALNIDLGKTLMGGLGGTESLIYINEKPVQGLDKNHQEVILKPEWMHTEELIVTIKAFSGLENNTHKINKADIVLIDEETEDFYYRAEVILEVIKTLESNDYNKIQLLNILYDSFIMIDFRKSGSDEFYKSINIANKHLKNELQKAKKSNKAKAVINAVGHSHIDVAWLWEVRHTREKCARSFSSAIYLMEQYPEYMFLQSSPQLYEFIKEDYPDIYIKIKEKVKEGQWEINGGMWLEADCNLPSGESLVRQFLFGTRFIREEFGIDCDVLWLPDAFGFPASLPQIIKKSGLKYFSTIKLSWNEYNKIDYDTFKWRGLDNTEVLSHFITTPELNTDLSHKTYNGMLNPESVVKTWNNYKQKEINANLLLAYGWGDGGGGPTKKMIEKGKKMKEIDLIPEVKFNKLSDFFNTLEKDIDDKASLPVWKGELYLEYHRGTYTSQALIKKRNRFSEILLHNIELYNSLISHYSKGFPYPQDDINKLWKIILKNQFHDILPGSSIASVYEQCEKEYSLLMKKGKSLLNKTLKNIASNICVNDLKLVVFNSTPWERDGEVLLPLEKKTENKMFITLDGQRLLTNIDEKNKFIRVKVPQIPSFGYKTFKIVNKAGEEKNKQNDNFLYFSKRKIENKYFIIEFNAQGQINSIYDKEIQREIITPGKVANAFYVFEDRPKQYDSWNIDRYYYKKKYPVIDLKEFEVVEHSSYHIVLKLSWRFMDSLIEQKVIVYADKRRIDFETDIEWYQKQLLLKASFPVDINSDKATYDIQFGNIERSNHNNTSWDYAKYEVAGHKWADLSERNYGVSLLNNCKYGYNIKENVIWLTLLKSAIYPDPEADQGKHSFTYSLFPHQGDWYSGGTVEEGYDLNYPLLGVVSGESGSLPEEFSFIEIDAESVILETVKKAEDNNSFVLRFYEYANAHDNVRIRFNSKIKNVIETNLLEEGIKDVKYEDQMFEFKINPYEIKTFKVKLRDSLI